MRVKVGDCWYSSDEQPICIQVSDGEQRQIANMDRSVATNGKYAIFPNPEKTTVEEKLEWMKG